jgi:2-amino-4-hydroxy-6-hydroxymethyldihydropteridine diphosphokinase
MLPERVDAFVALGSNLGDRSAHLRAGRAALSELPDTGLVASSRVYETAPVGPPPQGAYLNAVVQLHTLLPARELLAAMLAIEKVEGRRREVDGERWGPRTLDLDLLLYGDSRVDEDGLRVPHPRLHERAFVLEPLCELAGERTHPVLGDTLREWATRCRDPEAVWLYRESGGW